MIDYLLPLDELPDPLPIEPLRKPFDVTITPPGSKSITCRAYVLAALAKGESRIIRPLRAEDTDRLLDALCTLGAQAKWEGEDVLITGVNGRFPRGGEVNLGDGGTPTRFMIACACLANEPVVVDGSPRMRERPIAEGVDLLRRIGADIIYLDQKDRLPVRVNPTDKLKGGDLTVGKTASSQFISALLLIAPWCREGINLTLQECPTSEPYVELTARLLDAWGAEIDGDANADFIDQYCIPPAGLDAKRFEVEADASSAVYWLAARAIFEKSSWIGIQGVDPWGTIQPDGHFTFFLTEANHAATRKGVSDSGWMRGCDAREAPDGAMMLAVLVAALGGEMMITGLRTLRVKETDRVAALANELTKVGCRVEIDESDDDVALVIHPMPRDANGNLLAVDPVTIETYNDHRMAMAFAVLGLARPGLSIRNPGCVAKSYPGFWRDFARLYDG